MCVCVRERERERERESERERGAEQIVFFLEWSTKGGPLVTP